MERIREGVINRAAQIIYNREGLSYYQARNIARRELGLPNKRLPHLDKIYARVQEIVEERESIEGRQAQLKAMRLEALNLMERLDEFNPRLIGSVWRGNVRKGSDIDIHTFGSDYHSIALRLEGQYLQKQFGDHSLIEGTWRDYPFNILLYPEERLRDIQRCNILGLPIKGFSIDELRREL
jgi:predicted nucleotidyltransferase